MAHARTQVWPAGTATARLLTRVASLWALVLLAGVASLVVVFHLAATPVLTGSMRPTYSPGDVIITQQVPLTELHPGQIAVFTPPGETAPFAHRLTSVAGDPQHPVVTTRGDANPAPDPWHARLGGPAVPVVVGVLPAAGRVVLLVSGRQGHALVVALAGLILTAATTRHVLRRAPTGEQRPAAA